MSFQMKKRKGMGIKYKIKILEIIKNIIKKNQVLMTQVEKIT